jgi:hypothetical protein
VTRTEALAIVADPESGFNKGTYEWGEMSDLVLALAGDEPESPGGIADLFAQVSQDGPVRVRINAVFESKPALERWMAAMASSDDVLELHSRKGQ